MQYRCIPNARTAQLAVNTAMPNDVTVQAIAAVRSANSGNEAVRSAAFEPARPEQASASPIPNPSLQLDPALGLVVIEFRNDSGAVTTSIPTEREIAAYQRWEQTKFGPVPHGMHASKASTAPPPEPQQAAKEDVPEPHATSAK